MAVMIPVGGPQETKSHAEQQLYFRLKRELSDDFTVIHSLPWLAKASTQINGNTAPSGEIDFLVLHTELGVLALEVKGGVYKVEGLRFTHVRQKFSINPTQQVRTGTHGIANWLGVNPHLRWRIGYGLIFPHSDFGSAVISAALVDVTADPPESILIDRQALPTISERIREIMTYWRGALNQPALGEARMQKMIAAICPSFDGTPNWGTRANFDNKMWLQLTSEQTHVVNEVSRQSKALVTGWPGTGKTVIAIEVARQKNSLGEKILFLTFNKLLSEHVESQLVSSGGISVLTWHGFCAKAGRASGQNTTRDDWLESGCLQDFEGAVSEKKLGKFDTIFIDEAQTFRPEWIAALCKWHLGGIVAFCDETQVFSFEKGRASVSQLCQLLQIQQPFMLTIPLRSPKAVIDRLRSVRPPNHQLYSPRELQPDTIREVLVVDMKHQLRSTISELKIAGLNPSEIAVLSKYGWENPGQQADAHYETVSRFRGLEATAVIVLDADTMDDHELFSAYSRATSICIAFYNAEGLGAKPSDERFHQTLLELPANRAMADTAFKKAKTRGVVDAYLIPEWFGFSSVEIAWCAKWGGWLIERGAIPACSDLWAGYLLSHHEWPVFCWSENSVRKVEFFRPSTFDDDTDSGKQLDTLTCTVCSTVTPQERTTTGLHRCLLCDNVKPKILKLKPSAQILQHLYLFDELVMMDPIQRTDIQRKSLPLSLAAAALTRHAHLGAVRGIGEALQLRIGNSNYRAAMAFVHACIALRKSDQTISSTEISTTTYNLYKVPGGLSFEAWKKLISQALATFFNNRHQLIKISKGVYQPIPKSTIPEKSQNQNRSQTPILLP